MSTLSFIPWILIVQLGSGEIHIPFDSYGPFNSRECVKWEATFQEQGLVAECEAQL